MKTLQKEEYELIFTNDGKSLERKTLKLEELNTETMRWIEKTETINNKTEERTLVPILKQLAKSERERMQATEHQKITRIQKRRKVKEYYYIEYKII